MSVGSRPPKRRRLAASRAADRGKQANHAMGRAAKLACRYSGLARQEQHQGFPRIYKLGGELAGLTDVNQFRICHQARLFI
jgi:hypothetical protein